MNNSYWDYLEHHGILGQRWGIRRGDHYPLNPATDYSSEQKKLNPGLVSKFRDSKSNAQKKEIQKQAKQIAAQKKELENLKNQTREAQKNSKAEAKADAKEQKRVEQFKEDRQRKSALEMYRRLDTVTDQELKDYLSRIDNEKKVRELALKEYEYDHPVKTLIKNSSGKIVDKITSGVVNGIADYAGNKIMEGINSAFDIDATYKKDSGGKKAKQGPKLKK